MTAHDEAAHDEAWFRQVFRDHHRAVLSYAVRRVGPDAADDVVAEVFTTAWRRRDQVPESSLPWLYRTARFHILHRGRSAARERRLTTRLAGCADLRDGADRFGEVEDGELVQDVLSNLPERDAEILMLAAWEDLAPAGIAEVLGCTPVAARVRLHRARRRARAVLASADGAGDRGHGEQANAGPPTRAMRSKPSGQPIPTGSAPSIESQNQRKP